MQQPRVPNAEEIAELEDYVLQEISPDDLLAGDGELEDASHIVADAYVAVFDHYVTSSPGYRGKLMAVVWDVAPELYEVFVWRDGDLVPVRQSKAVQQSAE